MATVKGNIQVAKNRGVEWNKSLIKGKLDAQLNPTAIRFSRIKKAVSQVEIADTLKISLATFGSIERAKRSASPKIANEIVKKLGGTLNNYFKPTKAGRFLAIQLKKSNT